MKLSDEEIREWVITFHQDNPSETSLMAKELLLARKVIDAVRKNKNSTMHERACLVNYDNGEG